MATQRPRAKYHCTQAELYAICTIGWQSYEENLADFQTFSTLYTATTASDALAAIEAAQNLPDFQTRNQATETAYILMGRNQTQALNKWRTLRSYIKATFPTELQKPNIEAAGEEHYNKAATRNWGETMLMFTSAINFIIANTTELTTGGMPLTFQADFEALQTEFLTNYSTFTDSGQDEHEGTDAKVNANNAIYETLMRMFEDGQVIYETDPAKRDRFIFQRVKDMITSSPGSGTEPTPGTTTKISGNVSDSNTLTPITGATVIFITPDAPDPFTATTDDSGTYTIEFEGMPDGTSTLGTLEASAPNYDLVQTPLEVSAGNSYTQDFQLTPSMIP